MASSGLVTRMRALEAFAQDLANVNTTAYRGQRLSFGSLLAQTQQGAPVSVAALGVNQHSVLGAATLDSTPGQLQQTSAPMDLAIEGSGYLAIQTANGVRYTRNGNLHLSKDAFLETQKGERVLGETGPIRLPAGPTTISDDGTISVNGAVAGRLRLVEFDRQDQVVHEGGSNYNAPIAAVRTAVNSRVRQGMLEGANVNAVELAVGLITLQRHAEMLQRAMSAFHAEFNRSAVEELPRT